MFEDLLSSARGPGVIGTVLGLFVLLGFGLLFLFVTDERFVGWEKDPHAVLRQQEERIESIGVAVKNCGKDREMRAERRKIADKLADVQVTIGAFEPQLTEVQGQEKALRQELIDARGEWDKYRETYRVEERASGKGEKFDELTLADGKKLSGVTVLDVDAARMQVRHSGGISGIDWQNLPDELKDRFQFDVKEKEALLEVENVDARFLGLQKKIVETAGTLQAKRLQAQERRSKAANSRAKADELVLKSQQLPAVIQSKQAQIAAEQLKKLRRTEELTNQLRELERQNNALPGQISGLRSQASKFEQEATELDEQAADLERKLVDLQQQLKRQQAEADAEETAEK